MPEDKSNEGAVHEVKSEKDKPKPATFNLPIPDHANDFMDIIDGGGFSLDSEDEEIDNELPMENKSANIEKSKENVVHEVKNEKNKPKPASFNLPIPDHANDFMEIIDGGGFSLDSEDEEIENELQIENKSANKEKSGNVSVNVINVEDLNAQDTEIPLVTSSVVQSVLSEGSVSIIQQREIVGESTGVTITVTGNEKENDNVVKSKPVAFNLPIPDHANDFMEVIEGGGFSLDSEDEEIEEEIKEVKKKQEKEFAQKESKKYINSKDLTLQGENVPTVTSSVAQAVLDDDSMIEQKVITEGSVSVIKQSFVETKPSFNLPIPEHANDFLEVIESGGFSLEDEDEDEIVPEVTTSVIESVLKPEEKLELLDKSKNEIKKAEQNISVKKIEEDWVNVQKLLNKRMTVGQTSKPFKMSDCAKELKVVSEKLNSLPATVKKGDSTVIQKTIITIIEHITVWLEIIEQHVILINNTKNPQEKARLSKFVQDQLVNVTQQLTVLKQTTSTITMLRQEVITTVNWCLQSVENQILSIKHSHEQSTEKQIEKPENKSANIEKSKEVAVHEVKSEKDKPKPATFNLPIPDH